MLFIVMGENWNILDMNSSIFINKERIPIGVISHEYLCEYAGEFFSVEVFDILPNDKRWCYLLDGKYHEYMLNELEPWSQLINHNKGQISRG